MKNIFDFEEVLQEALNIEDLNFDDLEFSKTQKVEIADRFGATGLTANFERNARLILDSINKNIINANEPTDQTTNPIALNVVQTNREKFSNLKIFDDKFIDKSLKSGGLPQSIKVDFQRLLNIACGEMFIAGSIVNIKKYISDTRSDISDLTKLLEQVKKSVSLIQPHIFGVTIGAALKGQENQNAAEIFQQHYINSLVLVECVNEMNSLEEDFCNLDFSKKWYGTQSRGPHEMIALKAFIHKFTIIVQKYGAGSRKLSRNAANIEWIRESLVEFGFQYEPETISSAIRSLNRSVPSI